MNLRPRRRFPRRADWGLVFLAGDFARMEGVRSRCCSSRRHNPVQVDQFSQKPVSQTGLSPRLDIANRAPSIYSKQYTYEAQQRKISAPPSTTTTNNTFQFPFPPGSAIYSISIPSSPSYIYHALGTGNRRAAISFESFCIYPLCGRLI